MYPERIARRTADELNLAFFSAELQASWESPSQECQSRVAVVARRRPRTSRGFCWPYRKAPSFFFVRPFRRERWKSRPSRTRRCTTRQDLASKRVGLCRFPALVSTFAPLTVSGRAYRETGLSPKGAVHGLENHIRLVAPETPVLGRRSAFTSWGTPSSRR